MSILQAITFFGPVLDHFGDDKTCDQHEYRTGGELLLSRSTEVAVDVLDQNLNLGIVVKLRRTAEGAAHALHISKFRELVSTRRNNSVT